MMGKLIVEGIGTFFLVFTIGQTVKGPNASDLAPLAIGAVLMVMVYAGGHFSGGYYNPAVTLGVALRGKASWGQALSYMGAQILSAAAAAAVVLYIKGQGPKWQAPPAPEGYAIVAQAVGDFLFTFALVYVVLNAATAKGTAGNSFYGLAIGFTVTAGAFAVGPVSGGAFNPAVGVGLYLMELADLTRLAIYLGADLLGGAAAALVFRALDMGGDRAPA